MAKRLKAVGLFLAIGLVAGMTACGTSPEAEVETAPDTPTNVSEGGEDGEGADYSAGEQANADFEDKLSGAELLSALQAGGHVIYFRHAQTERDYADQADPNMSGCDLFLMWVQ